MFFRKKPQDDVSSENDASSSSSLSDGIEAAVNLFQSKQAENYETLQANKPTVMVVGRAGSGKSTLINAVFGKRVAKQGTGRPVTQNYTLYSTPDTLVNLYDTRGWEGGAEDEKIFYRDTQEFLGEGNELPPDIIWYVVEGPGARFTDYDRQIIRELFQYKAVIIAITKADIARPEQIEVLEDAIALANLPNVVATIPIAAEPPTTRSSRGRSRRVTSTPVESFGLHDLIKTTREKLPESRQLAFVAAQKADLAEKDDAARRIIIQSTLQAASVSAGGAFSPIPFAESPFLVGIQMNMVSEIANIYEVSIDLSQVIGGFVTETLASQVGKAAAAEALKVAVGFGTMVSATIKATISGGITMAIGYTFRSLYRTIIQYELEGKMDLVNNDWVKAFLKTNFQQIMSELKRKPKIEEYNYQ